jgi:hypothetical protein
LQRRLEARGVNMSSEADEGSTGPAGFMFVDPDGNTIPVDRRV